ncbi:hypothetical protein [Ralstonia phage RP12]|nr:hypothetical protein FDH28_gp272 [Ralstonia phage RP12]BAW19123.1 hypothetical protein [Ralstonia phage RP12]
MNVVEIDGILYIDGSPYNLQTLAPLGDNYKQGPARQLDALGTDWAFPPFMALQRATIWCPANGVVANMTSDCGANNSDYMNAGLTANGTAGYVPLQSGENFLVVAGGAGLGYTGGMFKRDRATMDALAAMPGVGSGSYANQSGWYMHMSMWLPNVSGSYLMWAQRADAYSNIVENIPADFTTAPSVYFGTSIGNDFKIRQCVGILGSYAVFFSSLANASPATAANTLHVVNRQTRVATAVSTAVTGAASQDRAGSVASEMTYTGASTGYFYAPESIAGGDNVAINVVSVDCTGTPTASNQVATIDWTNNGGVTAFTALSRNTSSARKIRASIIDRTATAGKRYLFVMVTEPTSSSFEAQAAMKGLLFEITTPTSLKFVQSISLADNARANGTLWTSDTHDRLIVKQVDRIAVYKFTDGTYFAKLAEYSGVWGGVGVDSTERIWMIDVTAGNLSAQGPSLYYVNPESIPNSLSVSFDSGTYQFAGTPVAANLNVDLRTAAGVRKAGNVTITITSGNAKFQDGTTQTTVTTLTTATLQVPVNIIGIGDVVIEATT